MLVWRTQKPRFDTYAGIIVFTLLVEIIEILTFAGFFQNCNG